MPTYIHVHCVVTVAVSIKFPFRIRRTIVSVYGAFLLRFRFVSASFRFRSVSASFRFYCHVAYCINKVSEF